MATQSSKDFFLIVVGVLFAVWVYSRLVRCEWFTTQEITEARPSSYGDAFGGL